MNTREQAIEAAARQMYGANWVTASREAHTEWREDAAAALDAVVPVLLNDLADRIEADAPSADGGDQSPTARTIRIVQRSGYESAAALVRAAAEGWGQ